MLQKSQRLTKRQFDQHFKAGKRLHSQHLQLIVSPESSFHGAAVVGKKVFKQAVKRNTMRRRLYGTLYRHHQKVPITGVFILIAKPSAATLTQQQLLVEANALLAKIKV